MPDGLKLKTALAMLWSVLRSAWASLATFLLFILLARLLGPAEFGIFVLARGPGSWRARACSMR